MASDKTPAHPQPKAGTMVHYSHETGKCNAALVVSRRWHVIAKDAEKAGTPLTETQQHQVNLGVVNVTWFGANGSTTGTADVVHNVEMIAGTYHLPEECSLDR